MKDQRAALLYFVNFPATPEAFLHHCQRMAALQVRSEFEISGQIVEDFPVSWTQLVESRVRTNPKSFLQLLMDRAPDVPIYIPPEDLTDAVVFFVCTESAIHNARQCLALAQTHITYKQNPNLLDALAYNVRLIEESSAGIFGIAEISSVHAFGHGTNVRHRFVATLDSRFFHRLSKTLPIATLCENPIFEFDTSIVYLTQKAAVSAEDCLSETLFWGRYSAFGDFRPLRITRKTWLSRVPEIMREISRKNPVDALQSSRLYIYGFLLRIVTRNANHRVFEHVRTTMKVFYSSRMTGNVRYDIENYGECFFRANGSYTVPMIFAPSAALDSELETRLLQHGMSGKLVLFQDYWSDHYKDFFSSKNKQEQKTERRYFSRIGNPETFAVTWPAACFIGTHNTLSLYTKGPENTRLLIDFNTISHEQVIDFKELIQHFSTICKRPVG